MAELPAHHGGIPTAVWVIGGGAVAVIGALFLLGGKQPAGVNNPSQSSGTPLDTSGAANAGATGSGATPMIPTLDASGGVQPVGTWPTGWYVAGPAPTVPSSQANNGTTPISIGSNQGVLGGMNASAPVWWSQPVGDLRGSGAGGGITGQTGGGAAQWQTIGAGWSKNPTTRSPWSPYQPWNMWGGTASSGANVATMPQ